MSASSKLLLATVMVVLTGILLASGSSLISIPLLEDPYVPLGNVMTWFALIFLPWGVIQFYLVFGNLGRVLEVVYGLLLRLAMLGGAAWPFLGRYLSGNWANSFDQVPQESALFWAYTRYLVITSLAIFTLALIQILIQRFVLKNKEEEEPFY